MVISIPIFIKPKIRKSADVFGVRRRMCRRTQFANALGLYVGVYAQHIAPAPIGVNRIIKVFFELDVIFLLRTLILLLYVVELCWFYKCV